MIIILALAEIINKWSGNSGQKKKDLTQTENDLNPNYLANLSSLSPRLKSKQFKPYWLNEREALLLKKKSVYLFKKDLMTF